jgi:predicted ATPase
MRMMSAVQIVALMRETFRPAGRWSQRSSRDAPGTIDGSWDLLESWERTAWAQCAVFEERFHAGGGRGGCSTSARLATHSG